MSQENVEAVRYGWEALIRGDIEAGLESYADDCVFEDFPEMPDPAVYLGHQGMVQAIEHFTQVWGGLLFEPVEFIDAGEDVVIAVVTMRGRGGGSGVPLDTTAAWLYEMRDGKVARTRAYTSKRQALDAVGLRE